MHFPVLHYPEESFSQTGAFTKQFRVYKYLSWRKTQGLGSQVWSLSKASQRCSLLRMDWPVTKHQWVQQKTPWDTITVLLKQCSRNHLFLNCLELHLLCFPFLSVSFHFSFLPQTILLLNTMYSHLHCLLHPSISIPLSRCPLHRVSLFCVFRML